MVRRSGMLSGSWMLTYALLFVGFFLGVQLASIFPEYHLDRIPSSFPVEPGVWKKQISSLQEEMRHAVGVVDHFDIVTLVHEDDLDVLADFGLESFQKHFAQESTRIYVICTPAAEAKLKELEASGSSNVNWSNVVLVPQVLYPFNLKLVGEYSANGKHTWIYQQLLKLYAHHVLSTYDPPLKRRFLIIDSDTVAVRPLTFFEKGNPIYNIAALSSGAFPNDCILQDGLLKEVFFDGSVTPAFPNFEHQKFTTITHHMVMDGEIVASMLNAISALHQKPAWQVLGSVKNSVLSEWELYMAWLMKHHRDELFLRQIPYMNSGKLSNEYLSWLREHRDVYYLSKHDDYRSMHLCCVNSKWPSIVEKGVPTCLCCPAERCPLSTITCGFLGLKGCVQASNGFLSFTQVL